MSVSKWAWTEECEGKPCFGDCDLCQHRPGERYTKPTVFNVVTAMQKIDALEEEVSHLRQIVSQQQETINTYGQIFKLQEAELERIRNDNKLQDNQQNM